jgi:hypothetical protein
MNVSKALQQPPCHHVTQGIHDVLPSTLSLHHAYVYYQQLETQLACLM